MMRYNRRGYIEQAIEDGNRMYGYGEPGYIDNDGNYRPFVEDVRHRKYRANRKLRFRIKPVFAVAVSKSRIQEQKEGAACLEFLRSKMRAADPILKESFRNKIEGVEF
jgi:hypothetical protein